MKLNKHTSILLAVLVLFGLILLPNTASAAKKPKLYEFKSTYYFNGPYTSENIVVYNTSPFQIIDIEGACNGTLKNGAKDVTVSKKKVATAYVKNNSVICLKVKKSGKTKVTFKVTFDNGKVYSYTTKVIINKNFQCPVKTLKIGSKDYKKRLNKDNNGIVLDNGYTNKLLKITPAKNWQISSIKGYKDNGKKVTLKNNKKIPSKITYIIITLKQKKTGLMYEILIDPYYYGE